jgi:hypothetical protein
MIQTRRYLNRQRNRNILLATRRLFGRFNQSEPLPQHFTHFYPRAHIGGKRASRYRCRRWGTWRTCTECGGVAGLEGSVCGCDEGNVGACGCGYGIGIAVCGGDGVVEYPASGGGEEG